MNEKSENRKALPKFTLSLLGSLLVGGAVGFAVGLTRAFGLDTEALARGLNVLLEAATPWGIPVTSVLTLGSCFFLYRSAARKFAVWDGGDEDETSESIDTALSWVLLLSAVQLLLNLFFLSAFCIYWMDRDIRALALVGVFLLSCGFVVFAQQKAVDLERRMNPEKRGSVYDSKFQKKWLDSCDEAERAAIGQCALKAFHAVTYTCLALWVVFILGGIYFEWGLLPAMAVCIIWGVGQSVYSYWAIQLSKPGRKV